ncbi:zinc-ribbon domain-containing protein [Halobacillus andaensis]|uniref:zinc-ribbon domain-containing protein n=1 Tax=Halobacillus andaensis TaxID=1176239 RepID=UPI003D70AA70
MKNGWLQTINFPILIYRRRRGPMVICRECGSENNSGSRFCSHCGEKLTEETLEELESENISSEQRNKKS